MEALLTAPGDVVNTAFEYHWEQKKYIRLILLGVIRKRQ
jgi:hypothetical protein